MSLQSQVFTIRVHEDDDGSPGREIASAPVSGTSSRTVGVPVSMADGIMLVVGSGRLGLQEYMQNPISNIARVPSQNERTQIINAGVDQLPDRWQGLGMVSTIVWADASPKELGRNEARAIRRWIERGGRLVIVLPETGDPWEFSSSLRNNYLLGITESTDPDLMPAAAPRRIDQVEVAALMQVLSKTATLRNPDARLTIRLFEKASLVAPWEPLAALPRIDPEVNADLGSEPDPLDGGIYAIQRRLGHGWIAFVGIDADSLQRRQLQEGGLPQADVFWNRILARRGSIPAPRAMQTYKERKLLANPPSTPFSMGMGSLILDEIRIGGPSAGAAVMIAFVIFLVYWILSGPGSFAVLRRKQQVRHAWVVFVGIGLVFTLIALVVAGMGRRFLQDGEPVRHITFLDIIDGEPRARATTWFSAYLPGYGGSEIGIEGAENLLSTWSPPPTGSMERFPDSDLFEVPTDRPNRFVVPTRATSAHFIAHWSGGSPGIGRTSPRRPRRRSPSRSAQTRPTRSRCAA